MRGRSIAPDAFQRNAVVGLTLLFAMQGAINMAVNVGLLPAKGMTLPFISYGGSSMLALAVTMGLLVGLARKPGPDYQLRSGTRRRNRWACRENRMVGLQGMPARGCIVVAAGGTGGHLFPAFALAEELQRRGYAVELMTDMRGDRYGTGFPARAVHKVHAATLKGRSPFALAKTGTTLARGIREAYAILGRIKPAAVVGFGGYSTFPPLMAARLRKIPTALHEQNAVMGRANRMLARRVTAIAASFEGTKSLEPRDPRQDRR